MKKKKLILIPLISSAILYGTQATGADFTLPVGGRVVLDMITSRAAFSNTLSLVTPNVAIATSGCEIEASAGLGGLKLLSEKISQRGCRVTLDADPATPGIQPFAAGEILEFNFCAQVDGDADCDYIWSSNPAENSDAQEHLITTELYDGDPDVDNTVFNLNWEDLPNLGDRDFDDLVATLRIVQDTDGDGLWDDWEKFGIDTNGDGTADFVLPDADFLHKDIYLEIDYMDCNLAGGDCSDTHSHEPKQDAIDEVVQAFADAPVANPDGVDGITLHVDIDDEIPHSNTLDMGCFGNTAEFDAIKNDPNFFGPHNPRRFAYHYVIFGHQQTSTTKSSGCGEVDGNDFTVTLGAWGYYCAGGVNQGRSCPAALGGIDCPGSTCDPIGDRDGDGNDDHDVGTDRQQAGTLMHELGHNLNLRHGGGDNRNYKPNYLSIMSYRYQFSGILPAGRLDYSGDTLDSLDESDLDETIGIAAGADETRYNCPDSTVRTGNGIGAIDWNCDNDGGIDNSVAVDINGQNGTTVLAGYNDWDNIKYDFQNSANFEDGVHAELDTPDMDFQTYLEVTNTPPVADAGIGQSLECTSADGAGVTLDASGSYDADNDNLTFTWTGDFGTLTGEVVETVLPLGSHDISLTVKDGKGASAGDSIVITVQDTTPPDIEVSLSPDMLWPVNHKMKEITADISVSDTCDPNPTVKLVSITNNESDNGRGDGSSSNDIQYASLGTDDRSFSLRAERSGRGSGRTYTVEYATDDASGNTATANAEVNVSRDNRR